MFYKLCVITVALLLATVSFADMAVNSNTPRIVIEQNIPPQRTETNPISFSGQVVKSVQFPRTTFQQTITVRNSQFLKDSNFQISLFESPLSIIDATFNKPVNFSWSHFMSKVYFDNITFQADTFFYFSNFEQGLSTYNIRCMKNCMFDLSSFLRAASFMDAEFDSTASFQLTHFKENASFVNCDFNGITDMSGAVFDKDLDFSNSFFSTELNLSSAQLKGNVSFRDTHLPNYVDFSNITYINQTIDLTEMKVNLLEDKININLTGANVRKIIFDYQYFKLFFPSTASESQINKVYEDLLNNYKNSGDKYSYNLLYAEYAEYMYLHKDRYIVNFINKHWWDYGTHPEWIFYWMLMFLLFFSTINTLFYIPLVTWYCDVRFLSVGTYDFAVYKNPVVRFIYYYPSALLLTLIIFIGAQFRLGITLSNFKSSNLIVNIYIIIILLSGIVCMFFVLKYLLGK